MIIIPIGFLLASIFSFYKGYKQWTSGSVKTTMPPLGGKVTKEESDKRVGWFSIGANIFGLILLGLAIGSYFWIHAEK